MHAVITIWVGVVLAFAVAQTGAAQAPPDSLLRQITPLADTAKARQLLAWCFHNLHNNPEVGDTVARLAERYARTDRYLTADAIKWQGIAAFYYQDSATARRLFEQSYALFWNELHDSVAAAQVLSNLGSIYVSFDQYALAPRYFERASELLGPNPDAATQGRVLNNLSLVYYNLGQYPKALQLMQRSLELRTALADSEGIAATLNNISNVYLALGDDAASERALRRSMSAYTRLNDPRGVFGCLMGLGTMYNNQHRPRESMLHYMRAYTLMVEQGFEKEQGQGAVNMGLAYTREGRVDSAEYYFRLTLEILERNGDHRDLSICLTALADLYSDQGRLPQALALSQRGYAVSTEIRHRESLMKAAESLYNVYKALGRADSALRYYEEFITLRDTLTSQDVLRQIARQEMTHEQEMERLRKTEAERLLAESTARRNGLIYSGVILAVVMVFGLILLSRRLKLSHRMIQALTFVWTLILFEFVLVLLDPFNDSLTQQNPLLKLLINLGLALVIFPVHRILERLLHGRVVTPEQ
jgi:tetratricopeptide (TPR) repeat protein